ncbi:MAG TPA: type I-C CRISPR-associated endonuclease Cas1c [Anaerolineaceae bacterium]|nr:type I-C CRISPR-associated endonuclease Cas1c [Anaerolineaceae bacterium]
MKHLANVLYITTPESYLMLEGESIVLRRDNNPALSIPLINLENIVCFNYQGVSPALMGACAERNIGLSFITPYGRFLARVSGRVKGNVLLRKKQYLLSEDESQSTTLAKSFLTGKLYNARKVIERVIRDHALLVDVQELKTVSTSLKQTLNILQKCETRSELMAHEGNSAREYFGVFNQLILQQQDEFRFEERSRRPPLDKVNALLSFFYSILANEVVTALETVGLDPYVGFLHTDRPGRPSLALDLMEELRPVFADRLVLNLINRKQVSGKGFIQKESGGILMDDETRKAVLNAWQERKKEEIIHPFLKEKISFGLIPYVQALLLARHLRGDLDAYPPFFWS